MHGWHFHMNSLERFTKSCTFRRGIYIYIKKKLNVEGRRREGKKKNLHYQTVDIPVLCSWLCSFKNRIMAILKLLFVSCISSTYICWSWEQEHGLKEVKMGSTWVESLKTKSSFRCYCSKEERTFIQPQQRHNTPLTTCWVIINHTRTHTAQKSTLLITAL